jgi:broad specificity phosphatase PhoE
MPETPVFYLLRHGETDANVARRFAGWSDDHLNDRGRQQCVDLADRLAGEGIEAVYTSPVRRAVETAEILAGQLGARVRTVHDLREIDVGPWKGLTEDEVVAAWPTEYAAWRDAPHRLQLSGREALSDVQGRALEALDQMAHARLSASEAPVLVVSHLAALRVLWLAATGRALAEYQDVAAPHCEVLPVRWLGRGTIEPGNMRGPAP